MSKYCILFLFFYSINALSGQQVDSVQTYYQLIQVANLQIAEAKYDSALFYYEKASNYLLPFSSDSYNACLCAIECKKYPSALFFAAGLVAKGVSLRFFEKNKKTQILTEQPLWNDFLATKPTAQFNKSLRGKIEQLLELDQKFRRDNLRYLDSLKLVDEQIELALDTLLNQYGYPSEQLIGIWPVGDTLLYGGWSPWDVLLIHQIKKKTTKYIQFLEKSFYAGLMQRGDFVMQSMNFAADNRYVFRCFRAGNTDVIRVSDELYTCCCEEERLINANRSRIFLPSLSYSLKMMDYRLTHGDFFLLGSLPSYYPYVIEPIEIEKLKQELKEQKFILYRKIETK